MNTTESMPHECPSGTQAVSLPNGFHFLRWRSELLGICVQKGTSVFPGLCCRSTEPCSKISKEPGTDLVFVCHCFMWLFARIRWEGRLGRWLRRATGVAWARGWSAPVCAVCYVSRDRCSELRHTEARTMAAVKLCPQSPCPRATLRIRLIRKGHLEPGQNFSRETLKTIFIYCCFEEQWSFFLSVKKSRFNWISYQ